uniref:Variant surface glycoprotein (VSG), putative n=1 Tax=Trypanosoma brucei brucei (strain 927/4 GUTat10.1) TaxID=185431 RepID=Q4FKN3_TRYB2|nr:variant surface glycoprotein (VSG), putative [Trypanosoma brucei brucei TREU927]
MKQITQTSRPANRQLIVLALAMLFAQSRGCEPQATAAVAAVTTPCHEVHYLDTLATEFEERLKRARARHNELSSDFSQLILASTHEADPSKKRALQTLAALTGDNMLRQAEQITQHDKTLTNAAATLRARAQQVKASLLFYPTSLALKQKPAQATADSWLGGGGKKCLIATEPAAAPDDGCEPAARTGDHISKAVAELDATETLKLIPDSEFTIPGFEVHAAVIGSAASLSLDNNAPGVCSNEAAAPASTANGIGIKSITRSGRQATPASYRIKQVPAKTGTCTEPANKEAKFLVTQDHVGYAVCIGRAAKPALIERPIKQTAETLKNNADAQATATLRNYGQIREGQSSDNKQQSLLTALGGGDENRVKSYDEALASTQIAYRVGADNVEASIRDSAKPKKFCKALAITFSRDEEARHTAQKAPLKVAQDGKECKDKQKNDCNGNCEWEGTDDKGTCKPKDEKEGVKAEGNEGKGTNTTGSNSFVINKAPLLLAVLLF